MEDEEITWTVSRVAPAWRVTAKGTSGTSRVTARWFLSGDLIPAGPSEVTVRSVIDRAAHPLGRGVTSVVLRDAEPLVARMTAALADQLAKHNFADPAEKIINRALGAMPASPRQNRQEFYRALLDLHQALIAAGHPEPINAMSSAMGVPKDTVKTRLRVAKRDADQAVIPGLEIRSN